MTFLISNFVHCIFKFKYHWTRKLICTWEIRTHKRKECSIEFHAVFQSNHEFLMYSFTYQLSFNIAKCNVGDVVLQSSVIHVPSDPFNVHRRWKESIHNWKSTISNQTKLITSSWKKWMPTGISENNWYSHTFTRVQTFT